ncbi:hypothetical protein B0H13DRAFT_2394582 [Mycena leptocephala]|nr:hypothetical protein B0H13DRAFT_2394582 [Mycena leptocephala]
MLSRSAPATSSPASRWPRSMISDAGRDPANLGTPLVSPLTPLPANVLDRTRKGLFGPEDPHPQEGTVIRRVQAARTTYGLSIVKATSLLFARGVQFYAAPNNGRVWNMEVPYVSDAQISAELPKYGLGVHREIQKDPDSSSDESALGRLARNPSHREELEESTKEISDVPPSDSLLFSESLTGEAIAKGPMRKPCFRWTRKSLTKKTCPTHDAESSRPSWGLQREILGDDEAERDLEAGTALALNGSSEGWVPAPDAWTPQNPMPLERWKLSQGQVERIPYNARTCNWQRSEVDSYQG